MTSVAASQHASQLNGQLCSLGSAEEDAFVRSYLASVGPSNNQHDFWIGGSGIYWNMSSCYFWWHDGGAWSYTAWDRGEPNAPFGGYRDVQLNADLTAWKDEVWSALSFSVVEWTSEQLTASRVYPYCQLLPDAEVPAVGEQLTLEFTGLPAADSWESPRIVVHASADIGSADERLYVRRPGGAWKLVLFNSARDCANPPANGVTLASRDFSPDSNGNLTLQLTVSTAVSAAACPNGFLRVGISYPIEQDHDCNGNSVDDAIDILEGTLEDCNGNFWGDSCELARLPQRDCDGNGVLDCCDSTQGADDCDGDGRLDRCQLSADPSLDCDGDDRLDSCELVYDGAVDFDRNGILDACDIAAGRLDDCNHNGVADIIDLSMSGHDDDGDWNIDTCSTGTPDLFVDGQVNSADLSLMLSMWGGNDPRGDLNFDGLIGASDLAMLLAGWGPIGVCGDGTNDPGENCCNCPQDAGCGSGFDCFYGACVPCPSGICNPSQDFCNALYGPAPTIKFDDGIDPCSQDAQATCIAALTDNSRGHRFAMSVLSPVASGEGVAVASCAILMLLAFPRRLLHPKSPRNPR